MELKTRQPTGRVTWPLILVEGPEMSGKTFAAAVLSASPKVGQTYWIDLGEGSADEYGAVPGARYLVVEHDGTWATVYGSVEAVHAEAQRAKDAGEAPVVLVVDSMTAEWDLLKDWATNRAKGSRTNREKLARDPHAEIVVATNYWNDANTRHRKLMRLLMTFPGIVVMTARGKEIAAIGEDGKPIEGKREYRVEGHKGLGYDASCWIRLSRDRAPLVVGARSVHTGVRPGIDEPLELPEGWTLEWVIFEALRCDPATAQARDVVPMVAGDEAPESPRCAAFLIGVESAEDVPALERIWPHVVKAVQDGEITEAEGNRVKEALRAAKQQMEPQQPAEQSAQRAEAEAVLASPSAPDEVQTAAAALAVDGPTEYQHRRMHAQWRELGLGGQDNRDERLNAMSLFFERDISTSNQLTAEEADRLIEHLDQQVKDGTNEMAGAAA